MSRASVLRSYRRVLRAARTAFPGDKAMVSAAHVKLRQGFEANRDESDPEKLQEAVNIAKEAALMLSTSIVQARHDPDQDVYKVRFGAKHATKNPDLGQARPLKPKDTR